MTIQDTYAKTTAMGDPLRSTSLLQIPFQIDGKQVMPLVTWFAWIQVRPQVSMARITSNTSI
jgi:hypothetical protein